MPRKQHINLTGTSRNPVKLLQNARLVAGCLLAVLLALGGCAQKYMEPAVSDPSDAVLVIRSNGMPMLVQYSISFDEEMCKGFEKVGTVFANTAKGRVSSWIAKFDEKTRRLTGATTELKVRIKPDRPIQVKAYSSWSDYGAGMRRDSSCGPLVSRFTPAGSHTYLVEFLWGDSASCGQAVSDITNPAEKKPVPADTTASCHKSWWNPLGA